MTRSTAAAEWIGRAPRRAGEWLLATAFGLLLAGGAVALLVHDPKQGWAAALAKIAIAAVGIGLTAIYISFAFGRRAVLRLEGRRLELIVGARRRVLATDEAGIKLGEWWHPRLGAMGLVLYLEGGGEKLAIGAAVSSIDPFRHELTARRANPRADFRLSAGDELGDLWRAVAATGARTVGERVDGGDPNVLELVESYGAESTWWIPFAWVGGAALIALTVVPSVGPRVGIPLVVAWLAGLITFITVRASRRNREERGYQMRVGPGGWQLSERKTGKTFASSHAGAVEFRPLHWETRGRYYHYAGPALSVKGLLRKRVTIAVMDPTQRWALDCPAANRIHYVCSKTDWPKLLTALAVNAPLGAHDPGHPS